MAVPPIPPGSLPYWNATPLLCHPHLQEQASHAVSISLGATFFLYVYTRASVHVRIYK